MVILRIIAALLGGTSDMYIKKMTMIKLNMIDITLISFLIIGFISFILLLCRYKYVLPKIKDVSYSDYKNICKYSILYIILTIAYFYSSKNVSNPGYTRLFYNTNVIFTFLLATIFFNQYIAFKTIIGIIITLIGLSIVILSKQ